MDRDRDVRGVTCGRIITPMRPEFVEQLQQLVSFGPDDAAAIRRVAPLLRPYAQRIVDRFYERLFRDPDARSVFKEGESQIERQRGFLAAWLGTILDSAYDGTFFDGLVGIGQAHVRAAVPQRLMVAGIEIVRQEIEAVLDDVLESAGGAERRAIEKLLALNLAAMLESYKDSYETVVRHDERRAVEEKLTRAEHLAEIGQLAASLAHEIKNPLAGISGAIQIIRETMPPENPHRPILAEVLGQIRRLDATVKDLLQYARPVPPRLKRCTVGRVINRLMAVLREEPALQRVRVKHNGAADDAVVMADENQLEQLLLNLIINAAHASREGDQIDIAATATADFVEVQVRDCGVGMPEEVRAQAFEPFYTTKAKGTGLGLSICRRIVDAHGGTIRIESEPRVGTTVFIQLPKGRSPTAMGAGK